MEGLGASGAQAMSEKLSRGSSSRFHDPFLDLTYAIAEVLVFRLGDERIETARVIDRPLRLTRNLQAKTLPERVANQRDVQKVRQEPAAGLIVRVADIVPGQNAFSSQFTTSRHLVSSQHLPARRKGVCLVPRTSSVKVPCAGLISSTAPRPRIDNIFF